MIVDFRRTPPPPTHHHEQHCGCSGDIQVPGIHHLPGPELGHSHRWKAQQRLYVLHQLGKFNLPLESVLWTSITVWFGSATKYTSYKISEDYREWFGLLKGLLVLPCSPCKNCIHPDWWKELRKSLWIPHIQVIPFLNFCHLAGATEPQIPGQPGTRTDSSPRQSTLWTVKCPPPPPHYAITMCNNLIYICYHLHPRTSLHLFLFYSILSSIAQLYIQFVIFQIFV